MTCQTTTTSKSTGVARRPPEVLTAEQRQRMVDLRRDFHRHPEIAHHERRTARIIAQRLAALGFDNVRTEVGQTGVVGLLKGGSPGKTILLRADMDALPLVEAD